MAEACETQDTVVLDSSVAKDMPDRAQILPNICCALHLVCKNIEIL